MPTRYGNQEYKQQCRVNKRAIARKYSVLEAQALNSAQRMASHLFNREIKVDALELFD